MGPAPTRTERRAVQAQLHLGGGDVGRLPRPTRITGSAVAAASRCPVGIVHPDHRPRRQLRGEQRGLGLEVGLHVGVEVQVVLGQVGEGRPPRSGSPPPGPVPGRGRRPPPPPPPPRRRPCGRAVAGSPAASGVVRATGTSSPAMRAPTVPTTAGTRPAAAAMDSTRWQVVVFPLVPVTPTSSRCWDGSPCTRAASGPIAARVSGTTRAGPAVRRVLLHAHRRGPGGPGLGHEAVPVDGEAAHRHEQHPGAGGPGVVGDLGHRDGRIAPSAALRSGPPARPG